MGTFAVEGIKSVRVNGASLAYMERGTGEPVVFVHGGYSDLRTWLAQIPAFAQEYRTITYSRRYARPNGDIPRGQDDQMMPHVNDLADLLVALDAVPAHLVGNSWGAFICLLAAIKQPALVRTLVLCEPPVLPLFVSSVPKPQEIILLLLRRPRTAIALLNFGIKVLQPTEKAYKQGDYEEGTRAFVRGILGADAYDVLPEARKEQMRENESTNIAQMLGAGFPLLSEAEVRGVTAPTLLVTGERSPALFRRDLTLRLADFLPNVRRVEIQEASHIMHEQKPAAFNEEVLSFLRHYRT